MGRKQKKDDLIPFEKSRRVIRLEKRGREQKKSVGAVIFGILAAACLLYCVAIGLFMGYGTRFFLIWGIAAVFFGLLSVLLAHRAWLERIPGWIRVCFVVLFVVGAGLFAAVEGMIFSQFAEKAQWGADYVIVLGAQWKQNGPSYVLQARLDKALEYLRQNPDAAVIVSGGRGPDEPISEAQGMKEYLMREGIEEERILVEDQATDTCENLVFSSRLLNREEDRVVLVTNNFHMFRALHIAQKQGYAHVEGLAAKSWPPMLPNNLLREFFGIGKDFLAGNL